MRTKWWIGLVVAIGALNSASWATPLKLGKAVEKGRVKVKAEAGGAGTVRLTITNPDSGEVTINVFGAMLVGPTDQDVQPLVLSRVRDEGLAGSRVWVKIAAGQSWSGTLPALGLDRFVAGPKKGVAYEIVSRIVPREIQGLLLDWNKNPGQPLKAIQRRVWKAAATYDVRRKLAVLLDRPLFAKPAAVEIHMLGGLDYVLEASGFAREYDNSRDDRTRGRTLGGDFCRLFVTGEKLYAVRAHYTRRRDIRLYERKGGEWADAVALPFVPDAAVAHPRLGLVLAGGKKVYVVGSKKTVTVHAGVKRMALIGSGDSLVWTGLTASGRALTFNAKTARATGSGEKDAWRDLAASGRLIVRVAARGISWTRGERSQSWSFGSEVTAVAVGGDYITVVAGGRVHLRVPEGDWLTASAKDSGVSSIAVDPKNGDAHMLTGNGTIHILRSGR